jgi:leucyl-tRNA synthetase
VTFRAGGRNFANKLWNATRFVVRSLPPGKIDLAIKLESLPTEDRWILSRLDQLADKVNKLMEEFRFGEAEGEVYEFIWGEFCDWYIELSKTRLRSKEAQSPVPVLAYVLETSLRLLHPYMPFITEELWQSLRERPPEGKPDSIMIAPCPVADEKMLDTESERVVEFQDAYKNADALAIAPYISFNIGPGGKPAAEEVAFAKISAPVAFVAGHFISPPGAATHRKVARWFTANFSILFFQNNFCIQLIPRRHYQFFLTQKLSN